MADIEAFFDCGGEVEMDFLPLGGDGEIIALGSFAGLIDEIEARGPFAAAAGVGEMADGGGEDIEILQVRGMRKRMGNGAVMGEFGLQGPKSGIGFYATANECGRGGGDGGGVRCGSGGWSRDIFGRWGRGGEIGPAYRWLWSPSKSRGSIGE